MFNLSIMELNIIVMFVITRHLEHNNSTVIYNLSMKEINNCEHYNHKATTKGKQKEIYTYMWNLSTKDLNIIVNFVTTRQLKKENFTDMWNLSMKELNIIVIVVNSKQLRKVIFAYMFVTTRQIQKGIYTYMCYLSSKELHMIVMSVTTRPL